VQFGERVGLGVQRTKDVTGALITAAGPHTGWRWIFLVNLAIGAVAVPAGVKFLPAPVRHPRQPADIAGLGLRRPARPS